MSRASSSLRGPSMIAARAHNCRRVGRCRSLRPSPGAGAQNLYAPRTPVRFWSPQAHCWDRRRARQHARDLYCTVRLYSTTTRLDFMLMSISIRGMHWNLLPMLIQRLHPAEPGGPPSPPSWGKWTVQSGSDSTQTVAGCGLPNIGRCRYVLVVTQQ